MPRQSYDREYIITLSTDGDYLRVGFTFDRGEITGFRFQFETTINEEIHPVIRCDCAHGFPHCDILDYDGHNVEKVRLPTDQPLKLTFERVVDALRTHWRAHLAAFLERRP